MTLAVFKAADSIDAVEKLALESGGYLVHRTDTEIKVRVPAAVFNSSLDKVTKLLNALAGSPNAQVKQYAIERSKLVAQYLQQQQQQLAGAAAKK